MRPVLFSLGPVHVYAYGAMIAVGLALSLFLMEKRLRAIPLCSHSEVGDMVLAAAIFGFLGARLYYVTLFWDFYRAQPWQILAVWEGGLVFYGGLIGGLPGLILYFKWKRLPVLKGLDFISPYVLLTQGFGRLGCFLNGCCGGKICSLPWAVVFSKETGPVHPAQLYEAFYDWIGFLFLSRLLSKNKKDGLIFSVYLLMYAFGRFVIEFFRDEAVMALGMTRNQWLSLALAAAGLLLGGWTVYRAKRELRS